jgi:hypothetical protein
LVAAGFTAGHKGYLKRAPVDALGLRLRAPARALQGPLGPDLPRDASARAAFEEPSDEEDEHELEHDA